MSNVFFIGDLHLGHKNVLKFEATHGFSSLEEREGYIIGQWCSCVRKNDLVFVLGDVAFETEKLEVMLSLPGRKILIRGNHDVFSAMRYLTFFEDIHGIMPYRAKSIKAWLSHAPIHPNELRGRVNIHGHVHYETIQDPRYVNVSACAVDYKPQSLQEVCR